MARNVGAYVCRNIGLLTARGKYVTFLDSDDEWSPTKLADQLAMLQSRSDLYGVTVMYIRVDEKDGTPLEPFMPRESCISVLFERQKVLDALGFFQQTRFGGDCEYVERIRAQYGKHSVICLKMKLPKKRTMDDVYVFCRSKKTSDTNSLEAWRMNHSAYMSQDRLSKQRQEYQAQFQSWHGKCKGRLYVQPFLRMSDEYLWHTPLLKSEFQPIRRKIYCGVATQKIRMNLLLRTIESILPQVDVLGIYLNDYDEVPVCLQNEPKIIPFLARDHAGDLKDVGKFYMLKEILMNDHDIYFTIDDDILYPPDYINAHVMKHIQYDERCLIGVHGTLYDRGFRRMFQKDRTVFSFNRMLRDDTIVNHLGTGTTSFPKHVADKIDIGRLIDDTRFYGKTDLMVAIIMKQHQIPNLCIQRPDKWLEDINDGNESLWKEYRSNDDFHTEQYSQHKLYEVDVTVDEVLGNSKK